MSVKVFPRSGQRNQQETQETPKRLGTIGRLGVQVPGAFVQGISTLGDIIAGPASREQLESYGIKTPDGLEKYAPETNVQKVQSSLESLLEMGGYDPEGARPQGVLEETLANIGQILGGEVALSPFTGGISPRALVGRAIGGGIGSEGAKKAGEAFDLGPTAQTALELGGTLLGTGLGGYIGKYGFRTPTRVLHHNLEQQKAPLYDQARQSAEGIKVQAPKAGQQLNELERKLGRRSPYKKDEIRNMINTFQDIAEDPNAISLQEVVDLKKDINEAWSKARTSGQKEFLNKLRTIAKEEILDPAAQLHPEWGASFNAAEDITRFLGGAPNFREIVKKNPSIRGYLEDMGPIGFVLASLYSPKAAIPIAALKGIKLAKNERREIWRALQENPTSRKGVHDMMEGIYLNKPQQVTTALRSIKNSTDTTTQKAPRKIKVFSRVGK